MVTGVKFERNSYKCYTVCSQRKLAVWDVDQRGKYQSLSGHFRRINDLAVMDEGEVVTVSDDAEPIL